MCLFWGLWFDRCVQHPCSAWLKLFDGSPSPLSPARSSWMYSPHVLYSPRGTLGCFSSAGETSRSIFKRPANTPTVFWAEVRLHKHTFQGENEIQTSNSMQTRWMWATCRKLGKRSNTSLSWWCVCLQLNPLVPTYRLASRGVRVGVCGSVYVQRISQHLTNTNCSFF